MQGAYCHQCGQPASTHRFSFHHVYSQNFLRGIVHLDKGFFFTLSELLTRPGHSIRTYIQGERVRYFDYFTLLLFLIVGDSILKHFSAFHFADLVSSSKEIVSGVEAFRAQHPKAVIMGTIPIQAIFSFLLFFKAKQNYAEHVVLNAYKMAVHLVVLMLFTIITIFYKNLVVLGLINNLILLLIIGYDTWFYYQYFSAFDYTKLSLFIRSFVCAVFLYIIIFIVVLFILLPDSH